MAKKNLYFRGRCLDDSREFLHAEILVFPANPCASCYEGISFTWQADADKDSWYAFHVSIEAGSLYKLNEKVKLARRVMGRTRWDTQPGDVLDRLGRIATEVTYDCRLSQHVPLSEVLPASFLAWRDDYRRMSKGSCTVGCIAESEDRARIQLLLNLAKAPHYQEYMMEWLQAGQPIVCLDDKRPDTTSARERLSLNREETQL